VPRFVAFDSGVQPLARLDLLAFPLDPQWASWRNANAHSRANTAPGLRSGLSRCRPATQIILCVRNAKKGVETLILGAEWWLRLVK